MYNIPLKTVASNRLPLQDIMKADLGASKTYLQVKHQQYLHDQQVLSNGPQATLPNNSKIRASVQGKLPLNPNVTLQALVYPHLLNESLLSIGQLCDEGCIAIFDKHNLSILKNGHIILSGKRNWSDGLWDVPFTTTGSQKINYIISRDRNKTELAQYLHGCAFSPVISTFQQCINNGNFITWPGIDDLNFKKLIDHTEATIKGHLDQERKNIQSTK